MMFWCKQLQSKEVSGKFVRWLLRALQSPGRLHCFQVLPHHFVYCCCYHVYEWPHRRSFVLFWSFHHNFLFDAFCIFFTFVQIFTWNFVLNCNKNDKLNCCKLKNVQSFIVGSMGCWYSYRSHCSSTILQCLHGKPSNCLQSWNPKQFKKFW